MTTTDWRGLCAELFAAYRTALYDDDLTLRARAALAQPEPALAAPPAERPPAMTISALLHPGYEPGDGSADGAQLVGMQWWVPIMGCDSLQSVVDNARAVLSRWGRPAPAPAGEVAELVAALRSTAQGLESQAYSQTAALLTRAADLLERQGAPVPVAVSERLPGDQLCWWFEADEDCGYGSNWTLLRIRGSATGYTHWLPAHALPLPSGEAQQ